MATLSENVKAALVAAQTELGDILADDNDQYALKQLRVVSSKLREARARIVAEQYK